MAVEKDKAYMAALRTLRDLIDKEYQEGGWLPPNLTMIERVGVSSSTYVKATSRLVREGIVKSVHRKGLFVPAERYRIRKIGFVVENGKESPFWGDFALAGDVMRTASAAGFYAHQLQGATTAKVFRSALAHCVKGLIWLHPDMALLPELKDCAQGMEVPTVAVLWNSPPLEFQDKIAFVAENWQAVVAVRAAYLLGQGHRKVLYVGRITDEKAAEYSARFAKGRVLFDSSCLIDDRSLERGRLVELVQKHQATALIVEGKFNEALEQIFRQLSTLPADKQPELLSHWQYSWIGLHRKYPKVKLSTGFQKDRAALGTMAADILLGHLMSGKPLRSAVIDNYHIVSGAELETRLSGTHMEFI